MAEIICKNGKTLVKFHAVPKTTKRVERVRFRKDFYNVYVDKNNSVYDIKKCEVLSWKEISKKKRIPEEIKETRNQHLFDRCKGNPFPIALNKILGELEYLAQFEK